MLIRSLFTAAKRCFSRALVLVSTLGAMWPPLVTLIFLTVAIVLPTQAHELYRIMIQDDDGTRVLVTLIFLAALFGVASLMGHALVRTIRPNPITGAFESFLMRTLPNICGDPGVGYNVGSIVPVH
jgi:hypothetical protein